MAIGFLRNKNLSRSCLALEARGDVDGVAENGVIGHRSAADIADERFAGADAGAHAQTIAFR